MKIDDLPVMNPGESKTSILFTMIEVLMSLDLVYVRGNNDRTDLREK